jgi:tRNA(fMet)-specific endonuclease VapC
MVTATPVYLVDTDIVIYWLTAKYPQIQQRIAQLDSSRIFISAITVAELYFGAYNSSKPQENCALLSDLLSDVRVVVFDTEAGSHFGQLKAKLKQSGQIINDSDLFIAATALSRQLILVTNNEKHFNRIPGLQMENWVRQCDGAGDS